MFRCQGRVAGGWAGPCDFICWAPSIVVNKNRHGFCYHVPYSVVTVKMEKRNREYENSFYGYPLNAICIVYSDVY